MPWPNMGALERENMSCKDKEAFPPFHFMRCKHMLFPNCHGADQVQLVALCLCSISPNHGIRLRCIDSEVLVFNASGFSGFAASQSTNLPISFLLPLTVPYFVSMEFQSHFCPKEITRMRHSTESDRMGNVQSILNLNLEKKQ